MDEVLSSIDATLAGADEDWDVSGDAMRWRDPEEQDDEESIDALVDRAIDAAVNEGQERVAHILATQPHTAEAVRQAIVRRQWMDQLDAIVPDETERDAYLAACDGVPSLAVEYASAGIPAVWVRDLRETGMTVMQAALTVHAPETSDARSTT